MTALAQLSPTSLWQWFEKICSIPHPSYHEQALSATIVNWAKQQKLWVEQDEAGNILIRKPATAGYENHRKIILQAHLDMVPQKSADFRHDFLTDPIKPYIEDGWVTATHTTLGADNGIGLSATLAVLEADNLQHPPLEVLLTVTEETGMVGAVNLKPSWLEGEWLINTDSEQDGAICIGCAGGVDANISIPVEIIDNPFNETLKITISGGKGGHSGIDINKGRANVLKFSARLLAYLSAFFPFLITEFQAGSVRNAIPNQADIIVSLPKSLENSFQIQLQNLFALLKNEYRETESNLKITITQIAKSVKTLSANFQSHLLAFLNLLPDGVRKISDIIPGEPESSLNISAIDMNQTNIDIIGLIRSLTETGKKAVQQEVTLVCQLIKADLAFNNDYPGWEPDNSQLLALTKKELNNINHKEAVIEVIHAGLECGIIKAKYPHLQAVSFGPTIIDAHSPDERVNIQSVERFWNILTHLLTNIPEA